ncbi:M12 family metallopeptidase [Pedobacter sp. L105]|uniref:M12 family metallopeptidase n=1 Tax=Pedobacter sp. L105 TaxID=1641871 RepID=UPI00131EB220|nr:M12 family metallopeptidase [Pedobacter sp. L105]
MKKQLFYLSVILLIAMSSCSKKDGINGKDALHPVDPLGKAGPGTLVTLKSGAVVEKKGDNYYWGGDILLSSTQLKALDETGSFFTKQPTYLGPDTTINPVFNIPMKSGPNNQAVPRAFSQYPTSYNMWAMVRFTYDANLPDWLKTEIGSVLTQIQNESNVRFYNATGQPTVDPTYGFAYPYVDFYYAGSVDVSDSYVGRQGGMQKINLADFVQFQPEAIIHEICHAIGMFHEAQRPDRDTYVTINTANLKPSGAAQFSKITTNYYELGTYDFNSVMGYYSFTSGVNGASTVVYDVNQPMYTKKDGTYINQGFDLSTLDKSWINTFYIPYIARSDVYSELAATVYKPDGTVMTTQERLSLQAQLNNGNSTPPNCCRLTNTF